MFLFVLLSSFLIVSYIRIVGDALDWDFPARFSASIMINENIHKHVPYIEAKAYESFEPSLRRRLLGHSRRIKQTYRDNDYNVRKRHQFQNQLDENRFYRSAVKDDEDEDDEEEEEEEEEEEDEGNEDKNVDEETEGQDENEEETVNEESNEIYDYG